MVLENWLTLSFRLSPFSALTFDVAAATGFSTCKHKTDYLARCLLLLRHIILYLSMSAVV